MEDDTEKEKNPEELDEIITIADRIMEISKTGLVPIRFEEIPLPTRRSQNMLVEWAIDNTQKATSKIVFHFKNIAVADMAVAGEFLFKYVADVNIGTSFAEASASPIFRNQWDFMYFNVPKMQAESIVSDIVRKLLAIFEKQSL